MNTQLEIAKRIIATHCQRHGFNPKYITQRKVKNVARRLAGIPLDRHRQMLSMYILDNTDVSKKKVSMLLGYSSHVPVINNVRKYRRLFCEGSPDVHNRYEDIAIWADELLK